MSAFDLMEMTRPDGPTSFDAVSEQRLAWAPMSSTVILVVKNRQISQRSSSSKQAVMIHAMNLGYRMNHLIREAVHLTRLLSDALWWPHVNVG